MTGNQPIKVGVGLDIEMITGDQPIEVDAGPDVEARASNQPIEADVGSDMEARVGGWLVEVVPSSLQGAEEVSPGVEPVLDAGGAWLEGASIAIDAIGQHGKVGVVMEIPSLMVEGSIKMAISELRSPIVEGALETLMESSISIEGMPTVGGSTYPSTLPGSTT